MKAVERKQWHRLHEVETETNMRRRLMFPSELRNSSAMSSKQPVKDSKVITVIKMLQAKLVREEHKSMTGEQTEVATNLLMYVARIPERNQSFVRSFLCVCETEQCGGEYSVGLRVCHCQWHLLFTFS